MNNPQDVENAVEIVIKAGEKDLFPGYSPFSVDNFVEMLSYFPKRVQFSTIHREIPCKNVFHLFVRKSKLPENRRKSEFAGRRLKYPQKTLDGGGGL